MGDDMNSSTPQPLQIISTGGTNSNTFAFNETNLKIILSKIPDKNMKVAILSVVGGFRSGKSFLLNFFLRYLRYSSNDPSLDWITAEGNVLLQPVAAPQPDITVASNGEEWEHVDGKSESPTTIPPTISTNFVWKGGKERQTTGVWIWSEPFIRETVASNGEKIALLLMDTQGIFDNETPMKVTTQIFGLSTLVSSFQIYNVGGLISEDKLQNLALFSEYGRLALEPVKKRKADQPPPPPQADSADEAAPLLPPPPPSMEEEAAVRQGDEVVGAREEKTAAAEPSPAGTAAPRPKPFQVMQFLVRDYASFEQDIEVSEGGSLSDSDFANLRAEMKKYIGEVMQVRDADLQQTRDQILKCFEKIDCFLLPHPGLEITRPKYSGEISKIEKSFLAVLDKYVRSIFEQELQAKTINGHFINGADLLTFFDVYSTVFEKGGDGKNGFPEPVNILEATARANNRSSYDRALEGYNAGMEAIVGHEKDYMKESALGEMHQQLLTEATALFDSRATMGAEDDIQTTKTALVDKIGNEYRRYQDSNSLRNPFKDMEIYVAAAIIAAMSWLLATIIDSVCSSDMCEHTEDTFVRVYWFILLALIFMLWKQISKALNVGYDLLRPFIGAQVDAALAELKGKVKLS